MMTMISNGSMKVLTGGINTSKQKHFAEIALFTWNNAQIITSSLIFIIFSLNRAQLKRTLSFKKRSLLMFQNIHPKNSQNITNEEDNTKIIF